MAAKNNQACQHAKDSQTNRQNHTSQSNKANDSNQREVTRKRYRSVLFKVLRQQSLGGGDYEGGTAGNAQIAARIDGSIILGGIVQNISRNASEWHFVESHSKGATHRGSLLPNGLNDWVLCLCPMLAV